MDQQNYCEPEHSSLYTLNLTWRQRLFYHLLCGKFHCGKWCCVTKRWQGKLDLDMFLIFTWIDNVCLSFLFNQVWSTFVFFFYPYCSLITKVVSSIEFTFLYCWIPGFELCNNETCLVIGKCICMVYILHKLIITKPQGEYPAVSQSNIDSVSLRFNIKLFFPRLYHG